MIIIKALLIKRCEEYETELGKLKKKNHANDTQISYLRRQVSDITVYFLHVLDLISTFDYTFIHHQYIIRMI